MYEPGMTDKELAELHAAGLTPDDVATGPVEIWPDCLVAFELFSRLATQWYVGGMGGRTGINYGVMHHMMDRLKLSPEDYDLLEADMQAMESAALEVMHRPSPDA